MNGRSSTGTIAFGILPPVTASRRVPSPPARTTAQRLIAASVRHDDGGALVVDPEADLAQPEVGHRLAQLGLLIGVEQEEPSAARADELPAGGASFDARADPLVDLIVR